jgi:hypothetical protein
MLSAGSIIDLRSGKRRSSQSQRPLHHQGYAQVMLVCDCSIDGQRRRVVINLKSVVTIERLDDERSLVGLDEGSSLTVFEQYAVLRDRAVANRSMSLLILEHSSEH